MLSNLQQPELPQPTTDSSRRTRRCSICRMQGHDRRFHTIAERTVQENMINANRELRQQRLNLINNNPSPISIQRRPVLNNTNHTKMVYFKYVMLQQIGRDDKNISNMLKRIKNIDSEYRWCLVLFARQLGCPPKPRFDDYVFRIVALLYMWFHELKHNSIDELVIDEGFMIQPESWYFNYCKSIAEQQKRERQALIIEINMLKQSRIDQMITLQQLYLPIIDNLMDCPICYEIKDKLSCVISNCNHNFCRECFNQFVFNTKLNKSLDCPMCRTELTIITAFHI